MGWVKLDDGFPHHPKVIGLSDAAVRAYIESLCYAAQYLTDGLVPNPIAANGNLRDELVAAGLWERLENSVRVHDYLVYNPSRDETIALKAGPTAKASTLATIRAWVSGGMRSGLGEFRSAVSVPSWPVHRAGRHCKVTTCH